jgi:hypothetical protein
MGDLATHSAGLEELLKQVVDRMTAMDLKVDSIQEQMVSNASRADALEARLADVVPPYTAAGTASGKATVDNSDGVGIHASPHAPSTFSMEAPPMRTAASGSGLGSVDHRDAHLRRGDAVGILGNLSRAPGAGTNPHHQNNSGVQRVSVHHDHEETYDRLECRSRSSSHYSPKMEFPKFDGENPKLWQQECETYFELYHILPALQTRYASLNFKGTAALWLRNVEAKEKLKSGEKCVGWSMRNLESINMSSIVGNCVS